MTLRAAARAMIFAGVSLVAPAVLACGFEDPAAMQTGILNWVYPKALYVGTAVWQAQLDGRIETDPPLQTANKLFVNPGYRKAARTLDEFASRFSEHPEIQERDSFVVLLLEAMLWSRISIEHGQAILLPHIKTPDEGEAVIITHRVVLEAINRGKLAPIEAVDLGLMRLYGSEAAIFRTMALFERSVTATHLGLVTP
jgi:hypothetical protein